MIGSYISKNGHRMKVLFESLPGLWSCEFWNGEIFIANALHINTHYKKCV